MRKTEIVAQIASVRGVEKIAHNYSKRLKGYEVDDLSQMVYVALLETDEDKLVKAWDEGWMSYYITAIIRNTLTPTGRYYKEYKKFSKASEPIPNGMKVYETDAWEK